jgi:hypothetical protein
LAVSVPVAGRGTPAEPSSPPDRETWAQRFEHQAAACGEIGSPLYARLLRLIAEELRAGTSSWDVVATRADLRFGQAGPLRLVGTAHRLALAGEAPQWAEVLPSCGGSPPEADEALLVAWRVLVDQHAEPLAEGLSREVQTNEVGRAAGLGLALAETGFTACDLVELGCSGGLNLRLDHFDIEVGGLALGRAESPVQLRPELRGHIGALRHEGLAMPQVGRRVGIDPHPVDPTTESGRLTLLCYVWPDQAARLARVEAAIELARRAPAELIEVSADGSPDTADALAAVLGATVPTVVQQSIMWQYVPAELRWRITEVMEERGGQATEEAPLGWVRFEPDEWDRRRAAVWLRRWPGGADRLVAHVDYHGRWLSPVS